MSSVAGLGRADGFEGRGDGLDELGVRLGAGVVAGDRPEGVGVLLVVAGEQRGHVEHVAGQLRGRRLVGGDRGQLDALRVAGDLGVGEALGGGQAAEAGEGGDPAAGGEQRAADGGEAGSLEEGATLARRRRRCSSAASSLNVRMASWCMSSTSLAR